MYYIVSNELYHHGIKGQKWGVRRYQNADGSLKPAGEKRYQYIESRFDRKLNRSQAYDERIMSARQKNRDKIAAKYDKKIAKTKADIDSFKPIKNGSKDKKGRVILTADDVSSMVSSLKNRTKQLQEKKAAKLKDFDAGTKHVKAGADKYNRIINNYKNAKLSKLTDSGANKSSEYKQAVKDYVGQVMLNGYFGSSNMTKLSYASDSARGAYVHK